jgi:hypothetical protein
MATDRMALLELIEKRADGDLGRELLAYAAERPMAVEVEGRCGAGHGERSPARSNQRNGCRDRPWDTRAGRIELEIPKLRKGTCFPAFLEPRRTAERALAAVIQEACVHGVSTRAVDDPVQAPRPAAAGRACGDGSSARRSRGMSGISKSQVSRLCEEIDDEGKAFLDRPIEGSAWAAPQGLTCRPAACRPTVLPLAGRDLREGPPGRPCRLGRGHRRRRTPTTVAGNPTTAVFVSPLPRAGERQGKVPSSSPDRATPRGRHPPVSGSMPARVRRPHPRASCRAPVGASLTRRCGNRGVPGSALPWRGRPTPRASRAAAILARVRAPAGPRTLRLRGSAFSACRSVAAAWLARPLACLGRRSGRAQARAVAIPAQAMGTP